MTSKLREMTKELDLLREDEKDLETQLNEAEEELEQLMDSRNLEPDSWPCDELNTQIRYLEKDLKSTRSQIENLEMDIEAEKRHEDLLDRLQDLERGR